LVAASMRTLPSRRRLPEPPQRRQSRHTVPLELRFLPPGRAPHAVQGKNAECASQRPTAARTKRMAWRVDMSSSSCLRWSLGERDRGRTRIAAPMREDEQPEWLRGIEDEHAQDDSELPEMDARLERERGERLERKLADPT